MTNFFILPLTVHSRSSEKPERVVTARYPNHVWHVDLTAMPTGAGFWVPWLPNALLQCWPFCWWLGVVEDHHSRKIIKVGLFRCQPSSEEIIRVLEAAAEKAGRYPRHIISDKGGQFYSKDSPTPYQNWCALHSVKARFGAVGKHGSIAIVERCIRTIKELLRAIVVPYRLVEMAEEVSWIIEWYNAHRPHMSLDGCTPDEIYDYRFPENRKPRFEPRPSYPAKSPCAAPQAPVRGSPGVTLSPCVTFLAGRKHLPIIEVRAAA